MMIVAVTTTVHNLVLWIAEFLGFAFLIALAMMWKFGAKRQSVVQMVRAGLDTRAARIDAQLRMAEESRAEAKRAHEEAQAEIVQAREEAGRIVQRAQGMTESLRLELAAAAEAEKERIIAQARSAIDAERNRAVMELRTSVADAAIGAAREVLRQSLDDRTDRAIVSQALSSGSPNGSAATGGDA